MRWYLSGPMSGHPEHNYPMFARAADHLRREGYDILSPHEINVNPAGNLEKRYDCLRNDIHALCEDCQGILLLRGWTSSAGALLELQVALGLGLDVAYYDTVTGEVTRIG